ncbi:MAG: hypothetical protein OJF47_001271 [Nitrospira sp.]|jgi:uncharacterized integral membrane protein|nr:MAG: hypothetical protein OJF47_001271 [Nitrospira sp.]
MRTDTFPSDSLQVSTKGAVFRASPVDGIVGWACREAGVGRPGERGGMVERRRKVSRGIVLVGLFVLALFALQNMEAVSVRFFLWSYETDLVLVILGSAALGACLAATVPLGGRLRRTREVNRLAETVHAQAERIRRLETHDREASLQSGSLLPSRSTDKMKGEQA